MATAQPLTQPVERMPDSRKAMVSGRSIARNTLWNLLGQGLPLVAVVVSIPILIKGLGIDRFGVLSLAWAVIGYFSLFDFGLGRAMTQLVAEKIGARQHAQIPSIVLTGLALLAALGVFGAILLSGLAAWLVSAVLAIPHELQHEALGAFYLLAVSVPFVISTAGLRGVLEAHQRFGVVNAIRVPMGLFTFIGPLMVLPFSHELVPVVAVLFVGRIVAWIVHGVACRGIYRGQPGLARLDRAAARRMMNFGGWMTVANLVGPLMAYMDRFVIGSVLSIAAVAYYSTPYDMVTKVWIIPSSLVGVLFPAFATSLKSNERSVAKLFGRAVRFIYFALYPIIFLLVAFGPELLSIWLGATFAEKAGPVLQLLSVGILINSLAHVPSALVQGAGRPKWTALLYLAELPFYLIVLWLSLGELGVVGAAGSWVLRIVVDTIAFFWLASKTVGIPFRISQAWLYFVALGAVSMLAVVSASVFWVKMLVVIVVLSAYVPIAWHRFLGPEERAFLLGLIKKSAGT